MQLLLVVVVVLVVVMKVGLLVNFGKSVCFVVAARNNVLGPFLSPLLFKQFRTSPTKNLEPPQLYVN